jgi:signal transduction histidine kinase
MEEKISYYKYQFEHSDLKELPGEIKEKILQTERYSLSMAPTKHATFILNNIDGRLLSETEIDIVKRFARVFEQAYTRFLDLQKAEAQAREAQIENALEKVRSRSLAMQKSDEIQDVLHAVVERMKELNLDFFSATIIIFQEGTRDMEWWLANKMNQQYLRMAVHYTDLPIFKKIFAAKENGVELIADSYSFEEKNKLFQYFFDHTDFRHTPEEQKKLIFSSEALSISVGLTRNIGIQISNYSLQPFSEKENEILLRFTKVFDQAYTRFMDLQKAEAQTRESQIEASLERVRSSAMAMHNSQDISSTTTVMFSELNKLGIQSLRCGVALLSKNSRTAHVYAAAKTEDGAVKTLQRFIVMTDHPSQVAQYDAWLRQENYFTEMKGEELKSYYQLPLFITSPYYVAPENFDQSEYGYYIPFSEGLFYAWTRKPYLDNEVNILNRFKSNIDLTFRRYLDLQKAEAQAKESQIEAALERVRSRTLAMQKSDELAETAAVLFRQLISLGIQPNRLYISIIKDQNEAEFWITDEDGSRVSTAFHTDMLVNPTFKKMLEGWKTEKKTLILDMQGEELENYFKHLHTLNVPFKGGLTQKRRVQHIAYFSKGFIGMASPDEQPAETMQLLERFASVFNLTFTRFNDLILAEQHARQAEEDLENLITEKKRTEDALKELRATQTQLIQSEKMASLGELTAGIAHEIQNPLNFVNNFSEVNAELIEELKDELATGNIQSAKELAENIKDNEEKIVFHGKRADGIVKSMLLHSRTGTGQKELTDLNVMVDEYIRLAYHGMRAKDKSFNMDFKTDLDPDLPKIKVMPQEIGRVLLNLINNAFQALAAAHLLAPYTG